jgi:serine/threonine protein phosphatase PrpC
VTAFPEIICIPRSRADEYIMVACDGIWDCLSNEECCKLINEKNKELAPKDSNICPVVESILE